MLEQRRRWARAGIVGVLVSMWMVTSLTFAKPLTTPDAVPTEEAPAETIPDAFVLRVLSAEEIRGSVFEAWVQVFNPYDERPLEGVVVHAELEFETYDGDGNSEDIVTLTREGRTDLRGEWGIMAEVPDASSFTDVLVTVRASYRGVEREAHLWAYTANNPTVILSSDKRLYQPGQTLHARGVWLDAADRARAEAPVELEILGPRGRQAWRQDLTTSRFGVAGADWRIPLSATLGDYWIRSEGHWIAFRISRYEMARFGLDVESDQGYYLPGEDAELKVSVTAVDGSPIVGAELEASLSQEVVKTAVTDDAGRAVLAVDLSGAHRFLGSATYDDFQDLDVAVTATDPLSRRSEQASVTIRISRQPIHIYVSGNLPPVPGVPSSAWVATFYPDGEPAPCHVEVFASRDGEVYSSEPRVRFATGIYGVGRLPSSVDLYEDLDLSGKWKLSVRDSEGLEASQILHPWKLNVSDGPAFTLVGRTLLRPDESLHLVLVAHERFERVAVELTGSTGTLSRRQLRGVEGPTSIIFRPADFPPGAMSGLLHVRAFPLDRPTGWDDVPMAVHSAIYPEHRSLTLDVVADRDVYRPGEEATFAVKISDANEAAIGVAIVDRGVELRQAGEGLQGPGALAGLGHDSGEVAGWTVDRLLALDPSRITADLDQLAAYLLTDPYPPGLDVDSDGPLDSAVVFSARRDSVNALTRSTVRIAGLILPVEESADAAGIENSGGERGVLVGTVVDTEGAALPGASVSAELDGGERVGFSDAEGRFRVPLAAGVYRVRVHLDGFNSVLYEAVQIVQGAVTELLVVLEVAEIMEELIVTAESPQAPLGGVRPRPTQEKATPRVRRDFPETLFWLPELHVEGGEEVVSIQLADALTTWKLAALASTQDGRLAVAEVDIPVTQPLSVDPDLPPILTVGDEVEIPVYLQNRSTTSRTVELEVRPSPGAVLQRPVVRSVDLDADAARRLGVPLRFLDDGPVTLGLSAHADDVADAIERVGTVRPAGYQHVVVHNALLSGDDLSFEVESAVVPGSARLEIAIDRGVADHLTSALRGLARRPTGCGEQQTSMAFLNLLRWQREIAMGQTEDAAQALANVELVRDALVHHVASGGGFAYWPGDQADLALTAYVLDFLDQIAGVVDVDPALGRSAVRWLLARQEKDGGFITAGKNGESLAALRLTAWVTSVLGRWVESVGEASGDAAVAVGRALDLLENRRPSADDPYALAHAVLAGRAVNRDVAGRVERLRSLAQVQGGSAHWSLEGATPFYSWGSGGTLETTAVAAEALWTVDPDDPLTRGAITYLLLEKDAEGYWASTQATVRVLSALSRMLPELDPSDAEPEVFLDGSPWSPNEPLASGRHRLSLVGDPGRWSLVRATVRSTVPWDRYREVVTDSEDLEYHVDCGTMDDLRVDRPVECHVEVERIGLRGGGMLIAEIGLPPGAEVDRGSLDAAVENSDGSFQRYEVRPDRVVAYLWPNTGGHAFSFLWRPRLVERAMASPSMLYDYYNPEARIVIEPSRVRVSRDAP